ncbi:putative U box domain, armadillo-like helical, Zinc finger, RING/FYVE/PHD-type [Helianthus anomalus]
MVGNSNLKKWKFSLHKSSPAPEKTKTKSKSKSQPKPLDEFICPISGSLMFEPVVVSSGQTFERRSVEVCRKLNFIPLIDGSKPDFSTVIPNLALKKAIRNWCQSTGADLPCDAPDYSSVNDSVTKLMSKLSECDGDVRFRVSERDLIAKMAEKPAVVLTHAQTQLNPRSVYHNRFYSSSSEESVIANVPDTPPLPLVTRPLCYSSSPSASTSSEVVVDETETLDNSSTLDEQSFVTKLQNVDVFEQEQAVILLRKVTRTDEEARVSLCTPRLLAALRQCVSSKYVVVQTNAVAALVNLSLEKTNKLKIVRSGIVPPLIEVFKSGCSESQEHAAGSLFSLSLEEENKTAIGVLGALQPLLHALRSDSERTRQDSALALYHLSLVQSNRVKLVKLGAVSTLLTLLETGLAGRVLLVLCNLAASSEGKSAMLDSNAIECLFQKLRNEKVDSNESTRENCVACLYSLSIGSMRFKGLARAARATEVLRVVEETGSERAREKAKRMLMMLRERDDEEGRDWDALLEGGMTQSRYRGISTEF